MININNLPKSVIDFYAPEKHNQIIQDCINNKDFIKTLKHLRNTSEEIQLKIIKIDPSLIRVFKKPFENVQLEAVKKHGIAKSIIDKSGLLMYSIEKLRFSIKIYKNARRFSDSCSWYKP